MSREIPATSYLILAMREKWLNLILDGKKTAEVRAYTVPDYPEFVRLWHKNTCALHHKQACLTEKEMVEYLNCAAAPVVYLLGRVGRFLKPIPVPCRPQSWQQDLAAAFKECGRVLAHKGTLVFKWNTCQLAKKDIEACFCMRPKFINRVGKTYIYIFYKK